MATFSASASSKRKRGQKEDHEEKNKYIKYARKEKKKTILTPELFVPMINSGNVAEGTRMFFQGRVPYKLIKTSLKEGLCHQDQMKLFLNGLAEKLGFVLQDKVKTVWLGVRKAFPHDPVFVLIPHNNENNLSRKDLPMPFRSFKCVFRHEYDVNDESREITYAKKLRNILLSNEEKDAVYKAILGNLSQLHSCHSNIEKMHYSAVRSIKYGQKNARLSHETCIVIYVHVKGIIPFSEEEFPSRIENFPVDVREGQLYPYKDSFSGINSIQWYVICNTITKTLMHLKGMRARLCGLPDDGVATLTCANMIWFEDSILYQPILPKFFIREDNHSEVGLDTAVDQTYNESRLSATETFQEDDTHTAGGIGLPPEILRMDEHSQQLFRDALQAGTQKVYNFRVMIVGHQGVGKTSLAKRLLGENVADISPDKTKGIEIHYRCCKIDLATQEWCPEKAGNRFSDSDQTLVAIVHEHINQETRRNIQNKEEMNVTNPGTFKISSRPNRNQHMSEIDTTSYSASSSNLLHDENEEVIYERKAVIGSKKPPIDHVRSLEDGDDCDGADKVINKDSSDESYFRKFVTRNIARTFSDKPYSYVTVLDFAGESVYYSTHQIFMSWRTVYLVVTDASKSLNDPVTGDVCSIDLSGNNKCSVQDIALYWLNSIFSHGIPNPKSEIQSQQQVGNYVNGHEAKQYPPVIIVATHMDKVPEEMRNKREEEYFESLGRILQDKTLRFLVKGTFAISNIEPDADINSLKQKIFELAQKQNYWGQEIPGRWAALEQKISELKEGGIKVIQYSDIEKISQSRDIRIENPEELELFLRFEHDLGHIMFFSTKKLRNNIILDPDWVIHGLNFLMPSSAHVMVTYPEVLPHWYDFKDTGRLRRSLVDCLWSEDKECYNHREHLLDVMENLSIIAQPTENTENKDILQNQEKYYWVPCMIQKRAPDYFKNTKLRTDINTTSTLCFVSKTKFIHIGVFHRLIASLLRIWPASKEGDEYQVFIDCCKFQVDDCHTLMVALADFVIHATVYLYSTGDLNNIICVEIKEFINSTLTDITSCICPSYEFDVYVKCDSASQQTTEGLLEISDWSERRCNCTEPAHTVNLQQLLKYWEKKDVRLSSLAKTDERECFNRISSLLINIGGKVLRRLLYFFTVRPNCSFDQFVQTKTKEILKLQKRKILNKQQIDTVLPQNGTTDLRNYDISLTSAFLINLIPNLNQHVKQKIKDVRNDRNKYQAHVCYVQMSRSDFNIHWPRITGNIIDLSKQFYDSSFEEEIQKEIQTLLQS